MRMARCFYAEDFRNLDEMDEPQGGEDLDEGVDLLLRNTPYSNRRQHILQNSDRDVSNTKGMETFCDFADYVL